MLVAVTPAQAAEGCSVWLEQNSLGQSRPYIQCGNMTPGIESQARADCTSAPDTYTKWVRSGQTSVGGYCLFGARGVQQAIRDI